MIILLRRNATATILALVLLLLLGAKAQSQSISITFPSSETIVSPGQTLHIAVSSSGVAKMAIVGSPFLGSTEIQSGDGDYNFSFLLPNQVKPGRYYLIATGNTTDGTLIESAPISIRVQEAGVSTLIVKPGHVGLSAPGDRLNLVVKGRTDVEHSLFYEDLVFSSADPAIATVSPTGTVTGESAGKTLITVTFGTGRDAISATVVVNVGGGLRGDLNNDGKVDIQDINILNFVLNTPANGPNDAKDLNHDGVIDALDARILVTLCTYPRCTTHP